jgi:hypothetical protein
VLDQNLATTVERCSRGNRELGSVIVAEIVNVAQLRVDQILAEDVQYPLGAVNGSALPVKPVARICLHSFEASRNIGLKLPG